MANPITNVGTYKGVIRSHAVSKTRKLEVPQFVVTIGAQKLWDEEHESWTPWDEWDQDSTGYFVLMSLKDGVPTKCLNYEQVMAATKWDGVSFAGLAGLNLKGREVQFRIAEDTYEGKTQLKMAWLDAADATFGLKSLSGDELIALDMQFGMGSSKKQAPKKAKGKAKPPTTPKTTAKASPPKPATAPKPEPTSEPIPPRTGDEAWDSCVAANKSLKESVPDDILTDYFVDRTAEIAKDDQNPTDAEYALIERAVFKDLQVDPIPF